MIRGLISEPLSTMRFNAGNWTSFDGAALWTASWFSDDPVHGPVEAMLRTTARHLYIISNSAQQAPQATFTASNQKEEDNIQDQLDHMQIGSTKV